MATKFGMKVEWVARWGKNGRFYEWKNPTQKQLDDLIEKYGIDQIAENGIWLQY